MPARHDRNHAITWAEWDAAWFEHCRTPSISAPGHILMRYQSKFTRSARSPPAVIGFAMQAAEQGDAAAVERWLASADNKIEQELRWIEENRCTAGGMASRR